MLSAIPGVDRTRSAAYIEKLFNKPGVVYEGAQQRKADL
jgi:hypothetical protein